MMTEYKNKQTYWRIGLMCWLLLGCLSCERFVEIAPPRDQLTREAVFVDNNTAVSAIRGIYNRMMYESNFASGSIWSVTALCGFSADEYNCYTPDEASADFYANTVDPSNLTLKSTFWEAPYRYIYYANAMLEGLNAETGVSLGMQRQLEGEARFIRAFCLFYLTNLFGAVPLVLTTDYATNAVIPLTAQDDVYRQVISDLHRAKELLSDDYTFAGGERVRPNKWAAAALLARINLYTEDWAAAEREATEIIAQTATYSLPMDLDSVFLRDSREAIWQLMPVNPARNTNEGELFILETIPNYLSLADDLVDAFEPTDRRRAHWVGEFRAGDAIYYYPFKYKIRNQNMPLTEYSMVLRLAEQYLIRAEAYVHLNDFERARADINRIRGRAGLPPTDDDTAESLLAVIEQERRIEFFAEWGHRWLDLKRTGRADEVLQAIKPTWTDKAVWYPIPLSDQNNNPSLSHITNN